MRLPPPTGYPPVLLTLDYAHEQPPLAAAATAAAAYQSAQLRLVSGTPNGNEGFAAGDAVFRDVTVLAQLSLAAGADDDLYGLYLRSPSPNLYYTFAVSPAGQVVINRYDGAYTQVAAGPLAPDMKFERGLGEANLFQVVAIGPSLTFVLNGMVVTSVTVDPRYKEGYLGFYVHHGVKSPRAELAADWIQVRAIFPEL
jgi:hypothetical protein